MLRNIIGPLFNFIIFCCFLACFSKILFFSAGRTRKKNKNNKIGPLFNFKKGGQTLDHFLTLQHIDIYIYRDRGGERKREVERMGHWPGILANRENGC